jgi:hypothetical protein
MEMLKFEFTFTGVHKETKKKKQFTIVAGSRIAAFDRLQAEHKDYQFEYE